MDDVAAALDSGEPLALLGLASSLLQALEPDHRSPFGREQEPGLPPRDEVLQAFFDIPVLPTSALLSAIAALADDDVLRRRVRREVGTRGHVLPHWLAELDRDTAVTGVMEMRHVLGDGEDVLLGVRMPGGSELTVAVYVDHNMGTLTKDAFVVAEPLPALVGQLRGLDDDPDTTFTDLEPSSARARIGEAIHLWSISMPPIETDTWPACRPLVEWAARMLPGGGAGYQRREWTDDDRQELVDRFFDSPSGAGLDDAERRDLLETLLWFGTDYGTGDPWRWSPVRVEMLLADWLPRKVVADVTYLAKAPDLLRAFVRFAHGETGIRQQLTDEALAAIDQWEPEYQRTIRAPRLHGPAALLERLGTLDDGDLTSLTSALEGLTAGSPDRLVGGDDVLQELDDVPLPDEPFDWARVPDDVRDRVAEVLGLVDRGCDELLDVELRTAARRLLAAVAAADPAMFRRRGRPDTAAAAVCWIVGKANQAFDGPGPSVKDLLTSFGVGANTPSQRGRPMLKAIGGEMLPWGEVVLGSPDYLTSARRREIVRRRDGSS
jgi:Domain of unknown function (DUF6398)